MTTPLAAWLLMMVCALSLGAAGYCWGWVNGHSARARATVRVSLDQDVEEFVRQMRRSKS